jgi:catechol 2,3-dioxygenase-like lactoylglutathione lyase family enzyme
MAEDHRPGAVYWIDHFVVPTNDLPVHCSFMANALGARVGHQGGLTTSQRQHRSPLRVFHKIGHYHSIGSFLQDRTLPPAQELGNATASKGFFVRAGDLDQHIRRLDEHNVPHTDPIATSEGGEEGTVVYFLDPDGNQFEFWAPRHMPPGAMEADNPTRVGRVSHATLEARDLSRTAEFISQYCAVDPIQSADIPSDTLVFRLEGGGRLIFKQVDELSERTGGHNLWFGQHLALTVRDDEFLGSYQRFWDNLPESEYIPFSDPNGPSFDEKQLPPRTELHGPAALSERREEFLKQRGTYFYDWDDNAFHLVGGKPQGGSMAHYAVVADERLFFA